MKYPRAIIDTSALLNNVQLLKLHAHPTKILAISKANAYGHGLVEVAQAIQGYVDGFGVARADEAELLRVAGIKKPIVLLEGFFGVLEMLRLNELALDTVVHCREQLELIVAHAHLLKPLNIWVKFNTGMNRLGFSKEELATVVDLLVKLPCVNQVNFMSHFARADGTDQESLEFTQEQISTFSYVDQLVADLKATYAQLPADKVVLPESTNTTGTAPLTAGQLLAKLQTLGWNKSLAASSGLLEYKHTAYDWERPGIVLYGISPGDKLVSQQGFQPVMSLETNLIAIHKRKPGDKIGYGGTYVVDQETYIGVIALGYGDGYPFTAPAGTPFYLNGRIVKLVGRVAMDMLTVDLGPELIDKVGDRVVAFGKELPAEIVAKHIGIIPYLLCTCLTERVSREYITS